MERPPRRTGMHENDALGSETAQRPPDSARRGPPRRALRATRGAGRPPGLRRAPGARPAGTRAAARSPGRRARGRRRESRRGRGGGESASGADTDLRRRGDDSATISVPLCDPVSVLASPYVLRPSRCLAALDLATRARGPHFVAVPMMCGDTGGTPMLKRSIVTEEKPACCRCALVRRSGRQPSATAFQRGRMPC